MRDFRTPAIAAFCTALLAACNGGSSLTGSMSATDSSSSNNSGGISVGSPGTSTPSNPTSPGGGGVAQSFELSLSGLNTGESVSVSLNGGRIGISNARPVQGCPQPFCVTSLMLRPSLGAAWLAWKIWPPVGFGAEPLAVAGPPSQRAAPPAWRPRRPSLQLRTSGPLPAR